MSNGLILYRGPSMIDGAPIVVIATGTTKPSTNEKTGDMIQTWILRDDIAPIDAANSGADRSVCGDCLHRGRVVDGKNVGRSCYVTLFQAPRNIWATYKLGVYGYDVASDNEIEAAFAGKLVRLGAYGNPSAAPFDVWQRALRLAKAFTGYVHNWRDCDPRFKALVMASCDSESDHANAKAMGWRTFRVRTSGEQLRPREIACPASEESGHKTTCADCLACGGGGAKAKVDIAIIVHGARAGHFVRLNLA